MIDRSEKQFIQELRTKSDKLRVALELREMVTQSQSLLNKEAYNKLLNNINLLIFELVSLLNANNATRSIAQMHRITLLLSMLLMRY